MKKEKRAKRLELEIKPEEEDEKMTSEYKKPIKDKYIDKKNYDTNQKIIDKNKERPKTLFQKIDHFFGYERILSPKQAKKLKNPNDPEVRVLERKNQYINQWGEVCKNRSVFLYEPYARYKRIENPSYAPVKKSSLVISLLGFLLAASGFTFGMPPLAYAGAALGLGSFGYYTGFIFGKKRAKPEYKNVSELEEKVQEKD